MTYRLSDEDRAMLQAALYSHVHKGHLFVPGETTDGEVDPRWCNECGESRSPDVLAAVEAIVAREVAVVEAARDRVLAREDDLKAVRDGLILRHHHADRARRTAEAKVAAVEVDRDYWKRQAEGFLRAATEDLGRYHRLRGCVETLADEWGWIKDEDESPTRYDMWRDLRAALGEARP